MHLTSSTAICLVCTRTPPSCPPHPPRPSYHHPRPQRRPAPWRRRTRSRISRRSQGPWRCTGRPHASDPVPALARPPAPPRKALPAPPAAPPAAPPRPRWQATPPVRAVDAAGISRVAEVNSATAAGGTEQHGRGRLGDGGLARRVISGADPAVAITSGLRLQSIWAHGWHNMRRSDHDRVREGNLFLEGNYFFPFFGKPATNDALHRHCLLITTAMGVIN